jgi:hypothetical protein
VRGTRWRWLRVCQGRFRIKVLYISLPPTSSLAYNMAAKTSEPRASAYCGKSEQMLDSVIVFHFDMICVSLFHWCDIIVLLYVIPGPWCTLGSWSLRRGPCQLRLRGEYTGSTRKSAPAWLSHRLHILSCGIRCRSCAYSPLWSTNLSCYVPCSVSDVLYLWPGW